MDRYFQKNERDLASISPLDRLAFISDRAMGALVFTPPDETSHDPEYQELQLLAEGAHAVLAGRDTPRLATLHQQCRRSIYKSEVRVTSCHTMSRFNSHAAMHGSMRK